MEKKNDETENLQELTDKEHAFLGRYFTNGRIKSEAYRHAYDAEKMNNNSIWVESSRLFHSPKLAPWVRYYEKKLEEEIVQKFSYSIKEAFEALLMAQELALNEKKPIKTQFGIKEIEIPNVGAFTKAEELKCKLAGHMKESVTHEGKLTLENLLEHLE